MVVCAVLCISFFYYLLLFLFIFYSFHITFFAFSFIGCNLKGILNEIQTSSRYKNIEKLQKMTREKTKGHGYERARARTIVRRSFNRSFIRWRPFIRMRVCERYITVIVGIIIIFFNSTPNSLLHHQCASFVVGWSWMYDGNIIRSDRVLELVSWQNGQNAHQHHTQVVHISSTLHSCQSDRTRKGRNRISTFAESPSSSVRCELCTSDAHETTHISYHHESFHAQKQKKKKIEHNNGVQARGILCMQ